MSAKPKSKSLKKASKASRNGAVQERGPVMNGAEILVASLEREDVEFVFAYPGGASMPIHQALTKSKKIRTILPRHEQGGGFAAEGYARATGKAGVCMATWGYERKLIARRCDFELPLGGVINLRNRRAGGVAAVAAEERVLDHLT